MDSVSSLFRQAHENEDGYMLAESIKPVAPAHDAGRLYSFQRSVNAVSVSNELRNNLIYKSSVHFTKAEQAAWVELYTAYWKAVCELLAVEEAVNQRKKADWKKVFDAWKEVVNSLLRGYTSSAFAAWTIPCLYVAGKYLRNFAIKADEQLRRVEGNVNYNEGFQDDVVGSLGKNDCLQDAARQVNRIFSVCITDRAPIEASRKWGLYYVTNLLFRIYFKLNSLNLAKNPLRSLAASAMDMPPLEAFPKSHQVTFNYYAGVIHFLEEDYKRAEEYLTKAWNMCHKRATKNKELILIYLIPCHLVTTHTLPTQDFLSNYPRLERLFGPLLASIKGANLAEFDAAMQAGEVEFVKRRIYLTLERGRDIVIRNVLRKVFILGGFDPPKEGQTQPVRRTRVPVEEFVVAIRLSLGQTNGDALDRDEVECMIANMIYKGLMKGYISRGHRMVVLSKGNAAFPGTGV
ncbi:uncharacterized protein PV09_00741 [Verruconis gallopava]|uniref:Protein CSN12 homolog n=1 Tax=Verruconis gallopava TaxID=253628 RepID=A0A0D1Z767_9PEZI|nr:uncharacterized protein PV09_00741 [Verruconis gallopava]KIW08807.1 hypothetical protein PV09_00741 [Verruconis gallopava]